MNQTTTLRDNVDAAEVAKFDALASRWWDRNSEFKLLHDINPLRANYIDRQSPVSGQRLVDVGCGGGILAEAMAQPTACGYCVARLPEIVNMLAFLL